MVLDAPTVATLRGPLGDEPMCDWETPSLLYVFLTVETAARPGMRIGVLADVLWPAELDWDESWMGCCDASSDWYSSGPHTWCTSTPCTFPSVHS